MNDTEKLWSSLNDANNAINALQQALGLPFRPIALCSVGEAREIMARECNRVKAVENANAALRKECERLQSELNELRSK